MVRHPDDGARSVRLPPNPIPASIALAAAILLLASCGGGGPSGPGTVESFDDDPAGGSNLSGIDLATYDARGSLAAEGGAVSLDDGATLSVAAGGLVGRSIAAGLRPAASAPSAGVPGVAVSAWYELALDVTDADATPNRPFTLEVPATPPTGREQHPGLRMILVLPGRRVVPIDGTFQPGTGTFAAVLPGLPASFAFAATFDDAIVRLDGADVADEPVAGRIGSALDAPGWATTEWVVDFDDRKATIQQARKLVQAAHKAAAFYSSLGLNAPFLYASEGLSGLRWHVHLTDDGSAFSSETDPASSDAARHFGRLFVDVGRLDSPTTDPLGSVQASVAHELFHAVFHAYGIPYGCFDYVEDGRRWCYPASSGYDEGLATAMGYLVDQGVAKPRPSEDPAPLGLALGFFDVARQGLAYRNQDAMVFLLRIGGAPTLVRVVESLAATAAPGVGASAFQWLAAYGNALNGRLGMDATITATMLGYVSNRGYMREPEGWLWPSEPAGGTPGDPYVLDASLFSAKSTYVDVQECDELPGQAVCTTGFARVPPLSGALVDVDVEDLARSWDFTPDRVLVAVKTSAGGVAFRVFGEQGGKGSPAQVWSSLDGAPVTVTGIDADSPRLRIVLVQGPAYGKVEVDLVFSGSTDAGPECRELAACCPNLPTQAVIEQCDDIVAKGDEQGCVIGQASLLRLCR